MLLMISLFLMSHVPKMCTTTNLISAVSSPWLIFALLHSFLLLLLPLLAIPILLPPFPLPCPLLNPRPILLLVGITLSLDEFLASLLAQLLLIPTFPSLNFSLPRLLLLKTIVDSFLSLMVLLPCLQILPLTAAILRDSAPCPLSPSPPTTRKRLMSRMLPMKCTPHRT